jgi:hypothetical protein
LACAPDCENTVQVVQVVQVVRVVRIGVGPRQTDTDATTPRGLKDFIGLAWRRALDRQIMRNWRRLEGCGVLGGADDVKDLERRRIAGREGAGMKGPVI